MIYRAITDLPPRPNQTEPAAFAGQLLFPWRAGQPKLQPDQLAVTVQPNGWGGLILADRAALDPMVQPSWRDFPQMLDFYLSGGAPLPHLQLDETPEGHALTLNNMACCAGWATRNAVCHVQLPGETSTTWARAFISMTQAGACDGTGALLIYGRSWGMNPTLPRTATFKICDHVTAAGAGANPSRGWHPSRCTLCGLNTSVDSGD